MRKQQSNLTLMVGQNKQTNKQGSTANEFNPASRRFHPKPREKKGCGENETCSRINAMNEKSNLTHKL